VVAATGGRRGRGRGGVGGRDGGGVPVRGGGAHGLRREGVRGGGAHGRRVVVLEGGRRLGLGLGLGLRLPAVGHRGGEAGARGGRRSPGRCARPYASCATRRDASSGTAWTPGTTAAQCADGGELGWTPIRGAGATGCC
jgi:hypothetical protein